MADVIEITPDQQLKLDVLHLFNNDTAAAQEALSFVGLNRLNYQLVVDQLANAQTETTPLARAIKSVSLAQAALALFPAATVTTTPSVS